MKKNHKLLAYFGVMLAAGLLTNGSLALADTTDSSQSSVSSESSVVSSSSQSSSAETKAINLKDYLSKKPVAIKVKKTTQLFKNANLTRSAGTAKKNNHYLISSLSKNYEGEPVLKTHSGLYLAAKKSNVVKVKTYQNPKHYHQVHYTRVKPYGQVGYTVKRNYEGIKTYLIMKRLGTYNGYNCYNTATWNAVRNFQARHGLKVTGNVNKATWVKLGLSAKLWTEIDSYTAPLGAQAWQGRKAHIEAMIKQAYKYLGNPYLVGSSSMPRYGTDCSGLVIQSLYAGGISPVPVSAIGHAHPGNEWNSRNLWADRKLKRVSYASRQRGDLVFYYQPGTHTIWHVAIYLGNNRVIESWPPRIMVQPISNGQRNVIAGIKRPFI